VQLRVPVVLRLVCPALLFTAFALQSARADSGGWTATLYGGPATTNSSSQIFLHGDFRATGGTVGIAVDHEIVALGDGFALDGEGQLTRYISSQPYSTASLGLGLRFSDFRWSDRVPTSVALFTGPSYADDPPLISTGSDHGQPTNFRREKYLNYVGAELAVSISKSQDWSEVLCFYHRSGAFGLFAANADEGSTIGIGIRHRF